MRAGFIGLGNQGLPIAQRIVAAGVPTTVWARRPESLEPLRDTAAQVAATPREVGAASDVLGICVFDAAAVEDVLFGPDGAVARMAPGAVVAVHSTVSPAEVVAIAERAAAAGVQVLDAPVSGGAERAVAGDMLVMAGGEDAVLERVRPVLETFASSIVACGPVGSAQLAKLLNNNVMVAHLGVVAEALVLGDRLGLRPDWVEVLRKGSAGGRPVEIMAAVRDPAILAQGPAANFIKDVELLSRTAADAGVPLGPLGQVAEHFRAAMTGETTSQG